jgi:hypothetical protein
MGAVTAPILSTGPIWPSKAPWLEGVLLILPLPFRGLVGQNNSRSLLKLLKRAMAIKRQGIISGQYTFSGVEDHGLVTLTSQVDDVYIIEIQALTQLFDFISPHDIPVMVDNTIYQVTNVASYSSASNLNIYSTVDTPRGSKTIIECEIKAIGMRSNSSVIFSTQEKWIIYPGKTYQLVNAGTQSFAFTTDSVAYLRLTGKRILPVSLLGNSL